jgi:hypothetical protein
MKFGERQKFGLLVFWALPHDPWRALPVACRFAAVGAELNHHFPASLFRLFIARYKVLAAMFANAGQRKIRFHDPHLALMHEDSLGVENFGNQRAAFGENREARTSFAPAATYAMRLGILRSWSGRLCSSSGFSPIACALISFESWVRVSSVCFSSSSISLSPEFL